MNHHEGEHDPVQWLPKLPPEIDTDTKGEENNRMRNLEIYHDDEDTNDAGDEYDNEEKQRHCLSSYALAPMSPFNKRMAAATVVHLKCG